MATQWTKKLLTMLYHRSTDSKVVTFYYSFESVQNTYKLVPISGIYVITSKLVFRILTISMFLDARETPNSIYRGHQFMPHTAHHTTVIVLLFTVSMILNRNICRSPSFSLLFISYLRAYTSISPRLHYSGSSPVLAGFYPTWKQTRPSLGCTTPRTDNCVLRPWPCWRGKLLPIRMTH